MANKEKSHAHIPTSLLSQLPANCPDLFRPHTERVLRCLSQGRKSSMSHSRHPLGREKTFLLPPPSFLGTRKTDFFFPLAVCVYTYVRMCMSFYRLCHLTGAEWKIGLKLQQEGGKRGKGRRREGIWGYENLVKRKEGERGGGLNFSPHLFTWRGLLFSPTPTFFLVAFRYENTVPPSLFAQTGLPLLLLTFTDWMRSFLLPSDENWKNWPKIIWSYKNWTAD